MAAKVIAFLNQKGGVGKTTSSTNIACELHSAGYEVILFDLDPQGSSSDWSAERAQDDTFPVIKLEAGKAASTAKILARDIKRLTKGYDFAVIDGAPQITDLAAAAVKVADLVVIPSTPSPYDLWACSDLVEIIKTRQEITDGKPKAAFLVTMSIKNTNLSKEVEDALDGYELMTLKARTTRSVAYAETAKTGGSVIDLGESHPLSAEIKEISKEIQGLLND